MKNYFEHEIRVKYIDGLLIKSQEWEWLINYIEENFEIDFSINSIDDFMDRFSQLNEIFQKFNSINEYIENFIPITTCWIKNIYDLSLYYVGKKEYEELKLNDDFQKVFALLVFLAKLNNENNENKYLVFNQILQQNNLFKLINITNFREESDLIIQRLRDLSFDTDKEKKVFIDNINRRFHKCDKFLVEKKKKIISANCFSFQRINDYVCETWEEEFLLDMLNISIRDGKLIPSITFTDGNTFPNIKLWTKELLEMMSSDFQNEDADFIIESIAFLLYESIPSVQTMLKHVKLLEKYYDSINMKEEGEKDYNCSSLEILLKVLNDNQFTPEAEMMRILMRHFNTALSKINNINTLVKIDSKYSIRDKKLKSRIKKYVSDKLLTADHLKDYNGFHSFITDNDVIHQTDNDVFCKVSDAFDSIIQKTDNISVSSMFLQYFNYLLKIKNNRKITSSDISKEINYIRHLWKEEYYQKSISYLQVVSESYTVTKETINNFNKTIIEQPYSIAYNCMILKEETLLGLIETITSNPLVSFTNRIELNEDFPLMPVLRIDDRHEIDMFYKHRVEKIYNEKRYRFINKFEVDQLLPEIYSFIKKNTLLKFQQFFDEKELYNSIIEENSEYNLLEYSPKPSLGHLTQLFPLLENKVREMGELFGIAPIREEWENCNRVKEPSSVLKRIIKMIFDETETIEQAADFMFIFYTMFAENGLNIRNSCVHGVAYNIKVEEIKCALKITLFCIFLINNRFEQITNNLLGKKNENR